MRKRGRSIVLRPRFVLKSWLAARGKCRSCEKAGGLCGPMPLRFMFGLQANGFVILQPGVICQLFLPVAQNFSICCSLGRALRVGWLSRKSKPQVTALGLSRVFCRSAPNCNKSKSFSGARLLVASPVANVLVFRSAREAVSYNEGRIFATMYVFCSELHNVAAA